MAAGLPRYEEGGPAGGACSALAPHRWQRSTGDLAHREAHAPLLYLRKGLLHGSPERTGRGGEDSGPHGRLSRSSVRMVAPVHGP